MCTLDDEGKVVRIRVKEGHGQRVRGLGGKKKYLEFKIWLNLFMQGEVSVFNWAILSYFDHPLRKSKLNSPFSIILSFCLFLEAPKTVPAVYTSFPNFVTGSVEKKIEFYCTNFKKSYNTKLISYFQNTKPKYEFNFVFSKYETHFLKVSSFENTKLWQNYDKLKLICSRFQNVKTTIIKKYKFVFSKGESGQINFLLRFLDF